LIPPEVIDKIFDVAPIEEVVGEYVTLKRAGANFKGLCPFHDDKSPSMSVSPSKGIFKCFSCG
jgi:DNA primase